MRSRNLTVAILVLSLATSASAAFLEMEWASNPGSRFHTMAVGETATINIRLDLHADESWGWIDVPIGMDAWVDPNDTPQFEITSYAADGFIGPGFSYDRSGLPPLPFAPTDYFNLTTQWDGATPIMGPGSIYLDSFEIVARSAGTDRIAFGPPISLGDRPEGWLIGADGMSWAWVPQGISGPVPPQTAGYWAFGAGNPGIVRSAAKSIIYDSYPLELNTVPEPSSVALVGLGLLIYLRRR